MENDLIKSKLQHLEAIKKQGINPYPYRFDRTHSAAELQKQFASLQPGEETKEPTIKASGRIMTIRSFGKLAFLDLVDGSGKIQLQLRENDTTNESLQLAELLDRGDFIGAEGRMIRTKRGEITLLCRTLTLLSKSILPLPEKWHGLQDVETRYRQRYLDLAMNPEVKKVFELRGKIIRAVRDYLDQHGFVEVEIPLLQPTYGGANAKPFKSYSNALDEELYLSISPELYLKRLIVGGIEKVYYLGKNFRNEDIDKTHNPEFTMMECYAAYWDYNDMMRFTENLYETVAQEVLGSTTIEYQGNRLELKAPWKRITMHQALKEHAQLDVEKLSDNEIEKLVSQHSPDYDGPKIRGLLIAELFEALAEAKIGLQPVFITDYPKETTPLCKVHRKNPALIERFEPMINQWEIGNAYSELNDGQLQRKLLEEQAQQGRAGGTQEPVDEDFITAMEYGMPPTGGLGLGIDRMVMLLTNQPTIKDVILFPQMKTSGKTTITKPTPVTKKPAPQAKKPPKPAPKAKSKKKKK